MPLVSLSLSMTTLEGEGVKSIRLHITINFFKSKYKNFLLTINHIVVAKQ